MRSVNADFETKNTTNISKADGGEISSLEKGIMMLQNKAQGGEAHDLSMGIMSIK